ncbi:unnamed protein product [Lampetra planeri]
MIPDNAPKEDVFHGSDELKRDAHISSFEKYKELYMKSIENPDEFWGDIAKDFFWKTKNTGPFLDYNFDVTKGEIFIKCMEGASTNICYNVLDRNVHERKLGDKVAFHWEGNEPGDELTVTYRELLHQVCRFANVLKSQGVKKGDRVSIYMPMVVELVVAMLACVRIGAVHSIVFAGFSAESLCERIMDSQCSLLITADGFYRGDKLINLKLLADEALQKCRDKGFPIQRCIMLRHLSKEAEDTSVGSPPAKRSCPDLQQEKQRIKKTRPVPQLPWNPEVDLCWHTLLRGMSDECEPEWCQSEDPLFILYTSGSTGKPKGVLHTLSGYMLYTATTFKLVFDHQPDDVYWCTADIGWITGHSYITYGPLANGVTSVLVFKQPWPGVMRTVYGNHLRFETTYFKKFPGYYVTGDGHLLSTAEVESALVEHEAVAEAAVVGRPHPVKGESLYCFVTLTDGVTYNRSLEADLKKQGR